MIHHVRRHVVAVIAVLAIVSASLSFAPAPAQAATPQDGVHSLVNGHRAYIGNQTLRRDAVLDSVAQEWANEMSRMQKMQHSTNDWRAARIPAGWRTNGENIAYGYPSADAVMAGWMASPGHRENILRPAFTRMGVGYVASGNYWVQIFAGYSEEVLSPLSAPTPTVTGTGTVGTTLTASAGTWGPAPVSLSYQWSADGRAIPGATGTTYAVKTLDVGANLSVSVTGTKSGHLTATRTSSSTVAKTNLEVNRIAGSDRLAGAVALSRDGFRSANIVWLANGYNFPDALSASPAAIKQNAPLLLTPADALDDRVKAEITRLGASTVVIVGGESAVSSAVEDELRTFVNVRRVFGADRYATSRAIAAYAFSAGSPSVFLATGTNFPDALSSGSAAGAANSPVLLVDGNAPSIDGQTQEALDDLNPNSARIIGGSVSISDGAFRAVDAQVATVTRLAGPDRFATSIAVNASAYSDGAHAYLALGHNFPDALAGSVVAGTNRAPLFITPTSCVPRGVLAEFTRTGITRVTVIGGLNSLSGSAAALVPCSF